MNIPNLLIPIVFIAAAPIVMMSDDDLTAFAIALLASCVIGILFMAGNPEETMQEMNKIKDGKNQ